jgi:hypothetical protein
MGKRRASSVSDRPFVVATFRLSPLKSARPVAQVARDWRALGRARRHLVGTATNPGPGPPRKSARLLTPGLRQCDPLVNRLRRPRFRATHPYAHSVAREPRRERGECPAAWKKPHEGRHNGATRVDAPVRHHQVPGGHLSLLSHALEKYVGFQILEGNWPQPVVPVPGKKLADRPAAEVALSVVEDDCGGCHGAGT